MEYYQKRLCISMNELVGKGVMTRGCYDKLVVRRQIEVARRGNRSCYALVAYDSLPEKYKDMVDAMYPDKGKVMLQEWVRKNYHRDQNAQVWFSDREKVGFDLKPRQVNEYVVNASVLNCCLYLYDNASARMRLMGKTYSWEQMADCVSSLKELYGHTLPESMLRFRMKANAYRRDGYASLVSGKFGNQNKRLVDYPTERLIVSLACRGNKPYSTEVHELYISFVLGEIAAVYDPETGELFNPDNFKKKNGEPKTLSLSTIDYYLTLPRNKVLIDKTQLSWTAFMHEQAPHMHRHGGDFSLSQITMDDVDLPRRMKGNQTVHAYYAYDVVSQCRIGLAYGRKKDDRLVVDCFRDMFRLIAKHGWGIPAGIEVENHLMSKYREGFLLAGEMFTFVRFGAPQNSQEKYAENLNGAFKTTIAHKNHEGIGRFYNKGKRRKESRKISDETNDLYEDLKYYTWEQLVTEDRADCEEWNNTLHPDQKKFPGMTRWQVLETHINPILLPYDARSLAWYIGEHVETSIRRNSTVRVAHEDWWLSDTSVLEKLEPNNYKVTACYMPDDEGKPGEVFIYQSGKFIDTVEKVKTYNRVMAEQTEEDQAAFVEQQKKVARFGKYVEDHKVTPVGIIRRKEPTVQEDVASLTIQPPPLQEDYEDDYMPQMADFRHKGVAAV